MQGRRPYSGIKLKAITSRVQTVGTGALVLVPTATFMRDKPPRMTLCFNEEGDASQIYMPVRVLSLEIREGHYAERGRSSLPRGTALSTNQMLGVGFGFGFGQASMLNVNAMANESCST